MNFWVPLVAALAAAGLTVVVMRLAAGRQLAESRAAAAAELATARRDVTWLREEVERHKASVGSTQALLDKADQRLRDAFQSLAAQALNDKRSSFFDLAKTSFESYSQ